jgi:hypothetical protein
MLLTRVTTLVAVLALGACIAIIEHPTPEHPTPVATSQPQGAITPEIPNLKPFPPEEPPAVRRAPPAASFAWTSAPKPGFPKPGSGSRPLGP